MTNSANKKPHSAVEDITPFLKWGKLITRITAIGVTIAGAVTAFFSSSSVTSGIALSAAGASTLAAAEKIPAPRYGKTRHIPPRQMMQSAGRKTLASDILPNPEKIGGSFNNDRLTNRPMQGNYTLLKRR